MRLVINGQAREVAVAMHQWFAYTLSLEGH